MRRLLVAGWLLAVGMPSLSAQSLDDRLADLRTAARVEQALGAHDGLRAFDYALRVEGGVLTLGGALPSQALRQEALALAGATRGVQQVVDSLVVPVDSSAVAADTTTLVSPPAPEMSTPDPRPETPPPATTAAPAYHTVERGDTLFAIAQRYGVTVADLRRLNSLRSNTLRIGQRLRVR